MSADLSVLLRDLGLRDVALVGFGMGTGEVTRYLATYGSALVRAAALLAPLPPFLLRTNDNPEGLARSVFDEYMASVCADRPAAAKAFLDRFYNIAVLGGSHVSDQAWQNSFHVAVRTSATAALDCVAACLEDFRGDLPLVDVPVLVVQGSQDRIFPPEATGGRLPALIRNVRRIVIDGGPNAIIWTHADQVNQALLDFIPRPGTAAE